ncbi:PAN2-PAN3 deadenylation complex catalytic subunit PAN2-like [Rhopilema esculentum]|uniref:PAN2-PAN3 deadenylation complex catalytic subunit PAN2-like n=1 Tax=Rhopilema esculentum TaxID=499914 RepID=UPI0031DAD50E|eukprot:gene12421-3085_t
MAAVSVGDSDSGVRQEFHELRAFMNDQYNMTTSVVFDPQEELFWVGTNSGHITSYYGPEFHKYTAFRGHITDVKQIVPDSYGVLSLTSNQIRYTTRQGLKSFDATEETMHNMQCMVHYDSNYVTIAGHQDHFYEVDMTSGEVYQREIEVDPGIVMMKHSNHFLCCGDSQGKVTLRDPETLESVHVLKAHGQALSDFDIHENTLVTTGFSSRYGHLSVDRFLMVYDLRNLRAFPPLQVPLDPYLVHFMPTYTTRCVVVSQAGQFLFCQPENLVYDPLIYQASTHGAAVMDFDISSSYQALAFADSSGCIHIWSDRGENELVYNGYSNPTLLADEVQSHPPLSFDDYSVSFSSIPMPECRETLLSDWPEHLNQMGDRKTPDVDPEILQNMTIRQSVGYAPNPKKRLRNQVAYKFDKSNFYGEFERNPPESPLKRDSTSSIPKMYRKVDIKYSKYGIENFDFRHYNHTNFAGLEIHIPNAYCNAMLQVLYFVEPLRCCMQNHGCQKEFCLACELGFLFRMLDIAEDQTCQATNFLRAFRTIREASAHGLILSDMDEVRRNQSLEKVIQNWHRFVLQQIHQDTMEKVKQSEKEENDSPIDENESSIVKDIFGSQLEITEKCKCGAEKKRDSTVFLFDMQYPEKSELGEKGLSFVNFLRNSISRQHSLQAWCEGCKKYQSTTQTKTLKKLPDVLSVNCRLDQARKLELWQELVKSCQSSHHHKSSVSPPKACRYGKLCTRQGCRFFHGRDGEPVSSHSIKDGDGHFKSVLPMWLEVRVDPSSGELAIKEFDPKDGSTDMDEHRVVYALSAVVSCVQDAVDGNTLVAAVHVGETYHERKEDIKRNGWYLFNDFAITPITEHEAVDFYPGWKVPSCVVYNRIDLLSRYDQSIEPQIDNKILVSDTSLAQRQTRFLRQFIPLNASEIQLDEDNVVGIDAEFVTLNQEESEMRSDGTLSTVKPSQMCAARITVVRGWGTLMGVPFIDDYISTSEQVVDYLTRFSGIKPGDLDANMSSKHLTTLKTTYQKLLHLIDRKITFIGHGLKKDFRVINIVVPRNQIIDTAELFRVRNQRYISLKFLAWHFLNIKIQSDSHDSAEDAYTAVKLFRKYKEIVDYSGDEQFDRELEILYDTGRQLNWQVPE